MRSKRIEIAGDRSGSRGVWRSGGEGLWGDWPIQPWLSRNQQRLEIGDWSGVSEHGLGNNLWCSRALIEEDYMSAMDGEDSGGRCR